MAETFVDDWSNSVKDHPVVDLGISLGEAYSFLVVAHGQVGFFLEFEQSLKLPTYLVAHLPMSGCKTI